MDFLRIGQKLYYINKFTGDIEFAVVSFFDAYTFGVKLSDGRIVRVGYEAVGPRLIPVSDVYSLPRTGVHPWEIQKLSWYNTRPRVYPVIEDLEVEHLLLSPPKENLCEWCSVYESGLCDGWLKWCSDYIPARDFYKEADAFSLMFEKNGY